MIATNKKQLRLRGRDSVKVTNIQGTTCVTVETTGQAVVEKNPMAVPYIQPYHTVAFTDVAKLKVSAHGLFRKVEVRLPADATYGDFFKEMACLFETSTQF